MNYLKRQIGNADTEAAHGNISRQDPEKRIGPEPMCDWCADNVPLYVYASSRMSTGEFCQCWRWMACAKCSRLIENGNWDAIERRTRARVRHICAAKLEAVSESIIDQAVRVSLSEFHHYAIPLNETGGGKSHL